MEWVTEATYSKEKTAISCACVYCFLPFRAFWLVRPGEYEILSDTLESETLDPPALKGQGLHGGLWGQTLPVTNRVLVCLVSLWNWSVYKQMVKKRCLGFRTSLPTERYVAFNWECLVNERYFRRLYFCTFWEKTKKRFTLPLSPLALDPETEQQGLPLPRIIQF